MQNDLPTAILQHRSGQLGTAAQLYQSIVSREPENAEAHHMLGVLCYQQGDQLRALAHISRALVLRPNAAAYHTNLAEVYRTLGDFERATGCCRAALAIRPDYPEALCNLGAALAGLGRHREAVGQLRRALELRPNFAVAHNGLGISLREICREEEALGHFRRAVALEPAFAPALTNLGQALLDRGQAEEALTYCQEAVWLDPNSAVMHHNIANVFRGLDRLVDARAEYLEALRLNPHLAVAIAHLGLVLQREGQLADALVWLKKAVELEPKNAACHEWLAELYDDMDEPDESLPCWNQVLALRPDRPGPHVSLGTALQRAGQRSQAREHYLKSLEIQSDFGPAHMHLGNLHEELGALDEAEAAFRTALQLQPEFAPPHARLATLLRHKLPDEDLAALEARLADGKLAQGPRGRLLFGLAHALDGRGEYARAAECLQQANALTLEQARGRNVYRPEEHERFVDGLIDAFDRDVLARLAGAGPDTRRPVFVFGLPRSGTTLIEQVLASHSQIHGAGELRLVRRTFDAVPALLGQPGPPRDCVAHLDRASVHVLAEQHLTDLAVIDGGKNDRIVDKMPDNYLYLGLLSILFPRAVFIHCRRDLRDVAVSCWMTDFGSIRWANHPDHIATRFQQYRRLMDHWREVLPVPIHHVDYEETVTDLESVARRLIAACGVDWEPACLEFHRTDRPVRTASISQVRQPVYQRSVARWKNYEGALGELFAALAGGVDREFKNKNEPPIDTGEHG